MSFRRNRAEVRRASPSDGASAVRAEVLRLYQCRLGITEIARRVNRSAVSVKQMVDVYLAYDATEIRRDYGLPAIVHKRRTCLYCGFPFESSGARLCRLCKDLEVFGS